eukprot:364918-Chlamydomonas_euryale.AAC.5
MGLRGCLCDGFQPTQAPSMSAVRSTSRAECGRGALEIGVLMSAVVNARIVAGTLRACDVAPSPTSPLDLPATAPGADAVAASAAAAGLSEMLTQSPRGAVRGMTE